MALPELPRISFFRNCFVQARPGEESVIVADGDLGVVYTRLDGYAVVPMEEYEHLKRLAGRGAQAIAGEAITAIRSQVKGE